MVSVAKRPQKGLDYRVALRRARRASATSGDEGASADPRPAVGNRTCLVTRVSGPRQDLLRFVVSPQGILVPDVRGSLPGRGLWLTPRRDTVEHAVRKEVFVRAARTKVKIPQDLADRVDQVLKDHCLGFLGFARRAGLVVNGFEKVQSCLRQGEVAVLLHAAGHGSDGCRQMAGFVRSMVGASEGLGSGPSVFSLLDDGDLGRCVGRDYAVHVAVLYGHHCHKSLLTSLKSALERLAGYRKTGIVPPEPRSKRPTTVEGAATGLGQSPA